MSLLKHINKIPEGYSEGIYMKVKYSITKSVFNKSKSFKIYAKELQGKNFISLNYYITSNNELLKPCEMAEQKVIHFLQHVNLNARD
jgi:peptide-methionine (S)-S-oxide reductase